MNKKPLKFGAWSKSEENEFFSKLKQWEEFVYEEYKGYVKDANFETVTKHSINMKTMLDTLPYKTRMRLINQYKSIIGFDETVTKDAPYRILREGVAPARQLYLDPSQLSGPDAHPLAFIFNRMFIQGDGSAEAPFTMSKNILRSDYLRTIMDDSTKASKVAAGKKVMVFDTETTGLPFGSVKGAGQHYPDIRQISAAMMTSTSEGLSDPQMIYDEHFRTARMQLGHLASGGRSRRMDKVIREQFMKGKSFRNRIPGAGGDFVDALKPFLEKMIEADYIVGHNVQFDIDQVLGGLARTTAYLGNQSGFRDLLDQARDSLLKNGKVRDTMEMARIQLHDIETAKEIRFMGDRVTRHSLENILLQTNLPDLLRSDLGDKEVLRMFGRGAVHTAEIDTRIEAYLYKYLTRSVLVSKAGRMDAVGQQIRQAVLRSYAPTPISNIADIAHIDRRLFAAMLQEEDSVRVMDSSFDFAGRTSDEIYDFLAGDNAPFATYKVTPVEQEIFATRANLPSNEMINDRYLALRQGQFRKWANMDEPYGGFLNRFATLFRRGIRPSDQSYQSLQQTLMREGVPFAGLSMPERWLTNALAQNSMLEGGVSHKVGHTIEGRVGKLADDLGIIRFAGWDEAYMSGTAAKNISLPIDILQAAEQEGVLSSKLSATTIGKEAQMLSLSAFETDKGEKMVNLVYDFADSGEASALADWLGNMTISDSVAGKTLSEYGFTPDLLRGITAALPTAGAERGINIARMSGKAGEEAFSALESFHQGMLRDTDKIPMRVGFMNSRGGVVRAGAVVLDRFMDSQMREGYADNIRLAMKRQQGLEQVLSDEKMARAADLASSKGGREIIEKSVNAYALVRKRLPVIGGLAALAFGGYYMGRRTQEQDHFDAALDTMPIESQRDYNSYRDSMGMAHAQARRTADPLATAALVGNLDRGKIGHHQMGTQGKYSDLYVGAL